LCSTRREPPCATRCITWGCRKCAVFGSGNTWRSTSKARRPIWKSACTHSVAISFQIRSSRTTNSRRDDQFPKLMKALRYFFCVVLPPVAVLMTGRLGSFFLSLILTLLGWIPGIVHACLVVNDYHEEQRGARYAVAREGVFICEN